MNLEDWKALWKHQWEDLPFGILLLHAQDAKRRINDQNPEDQDPRNPSFYVQKQQARIDVIKSLVPEDLYTIFCLCGFDVAEQYALSKGLSFGDKRVFHFLGLLV